MRCFGVRSAGPERDDSGDDGNGQCEQADPPRPWDHVPDVATDVDLGEAARERPNAPRAPISGWPNS